MFYGQFTVTIDQKGRIALPKMLREGLASEDIVLTEGYDGAIFGFDRGEWEQYAHQFLVVPLANEDARIVRRKTFASAHIAKLDDQGRCIVAQRLLKIAGLAQAGGEIMIVGAGDHFEIWDMKRWQGYQEANDA